MILLLIGKGHLFQIECEVILRSLVGSACLSSGPYQRKYGKSEMTCNGEFTEVLCLRWNECYLRACFERLVSKV